MKFIDKGNHVQVQIAQFVPHGKPFMLADFPIGKDDFECFLDHVIAKCKEAYSRDELFP